MKCKNLSIALKKHLFVALACVTGNEEIRRNSNLQRVEVLSLLSSLVVRCYFDEMCCDGEFL
jgi:hypothetical protein